MKVEIDAPAVTADADDVALGRLPRFLDAAAGFVPIDDARVAKRFVGFQQPGAVSDNTEHRLRKSNAAADVRAAFGCPFKRAEEQKVAVYLAGGCERVSGGIAFLAVERCAGRDVHREHACRLNALALRHEIESGVTAIIIPFVSRAR